MHQFVRFVLMIAATLPAIVNADSAYDTMFDELMTRYRLPGLAVGVIEDGQIVYARVAGETVAGSSQKITRRTLFKIASNSKAMTASALARLVDAGKLRWGDPVTKYLPQFRMHDPWVTREMQVRDLLIHNSGLPEGAGDLMLWPEPNRYTRADIIAGLAHLKPAYSFRAGYAYDNLLYVVAGEVAAAVGGAPYEDVVRREIFEPLGLGCRVGEWRRHDARDVAQPHSRKDGRNVLIRADTKIVPAITSAAAGGIRCSLDDMLAWARNWLSPDDHQGVWLSAEQRRAVWTPQTPMPISTRRREQDDTHFYAYGYGWRLADVDGVWTVSHTGTLAGMYSVLMLMPKQRNGFVMLTNGDGSEARTVLTAVLTKHFTAPGQGATVASYVDAIAAASTPITNRVPDTSERSPVKPGMLREQLGIWSDPWLGSAALCVRRGAVRFAVKKSPLLAGRVMQVGGRWLIDWDDDSVDTEAWIDFAADGSMKLSKVDPDADFSSDFEDLVFARERSCD